MFKDDEDDDDNLAEESITMSSFQAFLARLELYFSNPLSIFSKSLSISRSIFRRLLKASSLFDLEARFAELYK